MPMIRELDVARAVQPGAAQNAADARGKPIRVRVVLYDPLAAAGLYRQWEGNLLDVPVEVAASGVRCQLTMTKRTGPSESEETTEVVVADADETNADVVVDEDNLAPGSFVTIRFPKFKPSATHAAQVSIHTADGEAVAGTIDPETGDVVSDGEGLDEPHPRDAFRCRVEASYTVRIWLKPQAIVLHWSVSGRNPSIKSKAGRSYHFRVSEEGGTAHWLCGASETDPRFWRHNLRIHGVPRVPGVDDVAIAVNRKLSAIPARKRYWRKGKSPLPTGYAGHAGGFNTHSVGISVEGMKGAKDRKMIPEAHAMTDGQITELIVHVAQLCRAWRIDATDPDQLCTHYEVNRLQHNMNPPGKWDITWLPEAYQISYELANGRQLCTDPVPTGSAPPADQPFRHHRYVDVPLPAGFSHANTDRVSAYLRELIDGQP